MITRRAATASAVAVVGLGVAAWLAGSGPYLAVGDGDPGVVVAVGAPVVRLVADFAAVICVGSLAYTVFCTRPRPSGSVGPDAYRELRVASAAAACWMLAALVEVPLSAANAAGLRLGDVLVPEHLIDLMGATEEPRAWLVTAVLAAVTALGARGALRWTTSVVLLAVAVLNVLPPVVTGHGSADVGHDLALGALILHGPTACVWLGLLFAVLRRRPAADCSALLRYHRAAVGCWLVLVASGLVLAGVLVPATGWTSGYGLVLIGKTTVVLGIGVLGFRLRRRPGRLAWTGAEFAALAGVFAASVDLTHLPLPEFFSRAATTGQVVLGYDLTGPPTLLRLLVDWRPDVVFAPLSIALAIGYLLLVRRAGEWPCSRTLAWLGACLVLLFATSSGFGRYAAAQFSVHLTVHMVLSMLVPALLALGGPLGLLRASAPGLRPRLDVLIGTWPLRLLTHPAPSLLLFAGSPFGLYFTGVFDAAVRFHWAHLAIDCWFLVAGYLFFWPVIGTDPPPRPMPNIARLGVVLAAMPADVVFGAAVVTSHRVLGNGPAAAAMYQALALPWVRDLHTDQRLAGILALVVSELVLLAVLAALLASWERTDLDVPDTLRKDTFEKWHGTNATR
ncbi:cytochrome c oxidase assembly protein [Amycolatopsis sp. NPDC051373]|uniref:cytochrome c oxidase assembly protein n=1 Tax=Amycolatopsis sp. NPDC051373 TaxID=3155801 RepID=UPI00344BF1A5